MSRRLFRASALALALLLGASGPASASATELLRIVDEALKVEAPRGVVNINTATREQLCLLPGIGPSRAIAIVAYRSRRPFKRKEQLLSIRGIGRKSMIRLRPYIALQGPTTLKEKVARGR